MLKNLNQIIKGQQSPRGGKPQSLPSPQQLCWPGHLLVKVIKMYTNPKTWMQSLFLFCEIFFLILPYFLRRCYFLCVFHKAGLRLRDVLFKLSKLSNYVDLWFKTKIRQTIHILWIREGGTRGWISYGGGIKKSLMLI